MSTVRRHVSTTEQQPPGTTSYGQQQYHGILINSYSRSGYVGTQLYDPFNAPNAHGNLLLGLQTGDSAWGGAAVANGPLVYFASGGGGTCVYLVLKIGKLRFILTCTR
jgi:hypothetical protein